MYFFKRNIQNSCCYFFFVYNLFVKRKCFYREFAYEIDLGYFRYSIYNFFFKMSGPIESKCGLARTF